ncbi:MAG: flagellar motor protein [Armatimonadota bacterium]|nr:flagellar motor protein [bacterium]
MDLATILGLAMAWGAVFISLSLEGGKLADLFNVSAFVLVVLGTIGATVIGTSMKTLATIPSIVKSALVINDLDQVEVIDAMVGFAKIARREGVLALEEAANKISNRFMRKGIELVVDGTPSVMVREILETEIVAMQERHKVGETIFSTLGGFSPTLGIIGTVMGLISMLAKLNEPGSMGHAIAAAFVATLYGVGFANLIYLPIAGKLKSKTADEVLAYEMVIEGVMSIQSGDNPRIVETRMMAYLPPALRAEREKTKSVTRVRDKMAA